MVAAGAHSPLDRVRAKLEETFGAFDLAQTPAPHVGEEEGLVDTLTKAISEHKLVAIEYLKPEEQEVVTRTVEPYSIERRLPHWYVHTWDVERDQPRSYRLDRMRKAKLLRKGFKPREGFDPSMLHTATTARIWYSPAVARWEVEKGARPLVDGSALAEKSVGSADWLVGEVVSYRGAAIVLEPPELRARGAQRVRARMRRRKPDANAWTREFMQENKPFRRYVLRELERNGPMLSRDLDADLLPRYEPHRWWGTRQVRLMLEVLQLHGEIAVAGR